MYTMKYEQDDWGLDRILTVYRKDTGDVIGQRDPFMGGIPCSKKARMNTLQKCAREIILEHETQQEETTP